MAWLIRATSLHYDTSWIPYLFLVRKQSQMQIHCALDWSIRYSNVGLDNSSLSSWCYQTWRILLFILSEHWTKLITSYSNILPELDLIWVYITSRQLGYSRLLLRFSLSILVSSFSCSNKTTHLAANHIQAWMVNRLTLSLLTVEGESQLNS